MNPNHASWLICVDCGRSLAVQHVAVAEDGRIIEGRLGCDRCKATYPVRRGVPRFVSNDTSTAGFGLEWKLHARSQYDRDSGASISEQRFFSETRWPRRLDGDTILEVGGGSGRFTEHAAATGATVISVDRSDAVDVNYASNGRLPNVLIVQADLYRLPLGPDAFDRMYCFGVLQHTPDVAGAFRAIASHVKPGGRLAADVYRKRGLLRRMLQTKRWVRPLTRRLPPTALYGWCQRYVRAMWPITRWIGKIPRVGRRINFQLLVMDYRGIYALDDEVLLDWAVLDTFDTLSPLYDSPQTLADVRSWCTDLGLVDVEVEYGHNGIELRATRPPAGDPRHRG